MEQKSFTPEVLNKGFPSSDFIMKNRDGIVDFFGDNRDFYKELLKGNTNRSHDVRVSGESVVVSAPQPLLWLHDEEALKKDPENPPLNPLRINEGTAERIAKFFEENESMRNAFIAYSQAEAA